MAVLLFCAGSLTTLAMAGLPGGAPVQADGPSARVGWDPRVAGPLPPPIMPSPASMPLLRPPMPHPVSAIGTNGLVVAAATNGNAISKGAEVSTPIDKEALSAQGRAIVGEFFTTLKGELEAAIKDGGPASAVDMCQVRAPAIAASMSDGSGWEVGRTSLKLRNPNNAPDPWEKAVLEDFEARKAAGEEVKPMAYSEVVTADGEKQFRFMKAIPVAGVCLACHGDAISPDVAAAIDEAYPSDQATGYEVGDVRGAFTLTKPL